MYNLLDKLIKKYEKEPNILEKLKEHLEVQLPKILSTYHQREQRKLNLEKESEKYIHQFLNSHATQYFYIPSTNVFLHYKNCQFFSIANEDAIWHTILSDISSKKTLLEWKYKVKTSIIKKIKQRTIKQSIPESFTIQYVLNHITPTLLQTREQAKYFLTILGDNILKKERKLIHFINPKCKAFFDFFEKLCHSYFNKTLHAIYSFKYKFYDHQYINCRIINFNDSIKVESYWKNFLKNHFLDIIVVACHYSNRFSSSDKFIENNFHEDEIKSKIIYLKNKNENDIIDDFIHTFISKGDNNLLNISWNDMYFLWKEYHNVNGFPLLLFKEQFKSKLIQKIKYDEDKDRFLNVSSKFLKYIQNFCIFWNTCFDHEESNAYEINELCQLYTNWIKASNSATKPLTEKKMVTIIEHFYPNIEIKDKRYILNINCTLWNKKNDIRDSIEMMKTSYVFFNQTASFLSIYEEYCKYTKKNFIPYIMGKKYFENIILNMIPSKFFSNNSVKSEYWES